MEPEFTREQVEEAMDAYDRYRWEDEYSEIFAPRGKRPDFWVRSTRDRPKRAYPSRQIVRWLLRNTRKEGIGGGWSRKDSAATVLHNSGFIIVDENDRPHPELKEKCEDYKRHLISASGAPRVRLCARNYFIEPARENGLGSVPVHSPEALSARPGPLHARRAAGQRIRALSARPNLRLTEYQWAALAEWAKSPHAAKTGDELKKATRQHVCRTTGDGLNWKTMDGLKDMEFVEGPPARGMKVPYKLTKTGRAAARAAARENGLGSVAIRAGRLANEMGLENTPRNIRSICKALESREFRELAKAREPGTAGPNPSAEAEFHFELVGKPGGRRPGKFALGEFRRRTKDMPNGTEAERLRVERVGQDVFRSALVVHWRGRCPLTGISDRKLLRASHIKPWSKCENDDERLDPYNGLLLSALWDAAFDAGHVSFDDDGAPLFSPLLREAELSALRWQKPVPLTARHRTKLAWHRDHHGFKSGK